MGAGGRLEGALVFGSLGGQDVRSRGHWVVAAAKKYRTMTRAGTKTYVPKGLDRRRRRLERRVGARARSEAAAQPTDVAVDDASAQDWLLDGGLSRRPAMVPSRRANSPTL